MQRVVRATAVTAVIALASCAGSTEGLVGEVLYTRSCAGCHGADGRGGTGPPLGAGSNAASLTDDQIAGAIRVGPGSMPSFHRLTDQQVDSLVAFIRGLQEE